MPSVAGIRMADPGSPASTNTSLAPVASEPGQIVVLVVSVGVSVIVDVVVEVDVMTGVVVDSTAFVTVVGVLTTSTLVAVTVVLVVVVAVNVAADHRVLVLVAFCCGPPSTVRVIVRVWIAVWTSCEQADEIRHSGKDLRKLGRVGEPRSSRACASAQARAAGRWWG